MGPRQKPNRPLVAPLILFSRIFFFSAFRVVFRRTRLTTSALEVSLFHTSSNHTNTRVLHTKKKTGRKSPCKRTLMSAHPCIRRVRISMRPISFSTSRYSLPRRHLFDLQIEWERSTSKYIKRKIGWEKLKIWRDVSDETLPACSAFTTISHFRCPNGCVKYQTKHAVFKTSNENVEIISFTDDISNIYLGPRDRTRRKTHQRTAD